MKRIIFIIILAFISVGLYSTNWIKTAVYQNGTWYPWREGSYVTLSGTWNFFAVHSEHNDASQFYFRIKIDNFTIPSKKVRKEHIKNNKWYEYSGYIEYWIDDEHMDFVSAIGKDSSLGVVPDAVTPWGKYDGRPVIAKKSPAIIQIQPYKNNPQLFNIWFEGIGYAFYFYSKGY